jgi:programmed cell death 6-interacting protein
MNKIQAYQAAGGLNCLTDLSKAKESLAREDEHTLLEAIKALDEEEEENRAAIAMYGSAWNRKPSHLLTEQLRSDGQSYHNKLQHAKKSDELVRSKLDPHREMLRRLTQPAEHIVRLLPVPSMSPLMRQPCVQTLRHQLHSLDSVVAERTRLRATLRTTSDQDDITAALVAAPEDEHEHVFQEALAKYASFSEQVQRNVSAQEKLFATISDANHKFAALRRQAPPDPNTEQRQRLCQQMHSALVSFDQVLANLQEGIRFYTRFQDLLRKYHMACKDFAMARRIDKVESEAQARQALAARAAPPAGYPGAPPPSSASTHASSSSPAGPSASAHLYGTTGGYATDIPRMPPSGASARFQPPPMPSFGGAAFPPPGSTLQGGPAMHAYPPPGTNLPPRAGSAAHPYSPPAHGSQPPPGHYYYPGQ